MNRLADTLFRSLTLAAFALPVLSASAAAQPAERGPAFDIFGGYLGSSDSGHPRTFGVRGSYRFTDVWAVEAAVSKVDIGGEVGFGDVSAKAYFFRADRFRIYALAGAGLFRSRFFGDTFEEDTIHLGLGTEIALGARTYLRPEIRSRWEINDIQWNARLTEYSLGFGWKF
jgi:opacity protein-like surface antigen